MFEKNRELKMNFGIKHYYKPTPVEIRSVGDALLAVAGNSVILATVLNIFGVDSVITQGFCLTIAISGIVGKFITNFYAE